MSSSVAILNLQSVTVVAAQSYARTVVEELARGWGISEEMLAGGLAKVGLASVCVAAAPAETKRGARKQKADPSDAGSVASAGPKRGGWDKMTPEQKAERVAKLQAGRKAKAAAKATAAPTAESAAPEAPVAAPTAAPTAPDADAKGKRGGWDKMTPEQKAERVAKMQAGRTAKKAASPVAAAAAPAPAPVAVPAPAPVAVPAPAPAPVAAPTPVAEKVEAGADLYVEEWLVNGKAYLKSPEGFLFDIETQEPVGFVNEKGEIEEVEEA